MVTMDRYHNDLQTIAIDRDLVLIKAGFLAIASSESNSDEKKQIYAGGYRDPHRAYRE